MNRINIRNVQAVRERLLEQIFILKSMIESIDKAEKTLQEMSLMEETLQLLRKSREELEREIQGHQSMADCLESVCRIYQKTEERIVQMYDLERVIYPKTEFGVSDLADLDDFSDMIMFS